MKLFGNRPKGHSGTAKFDGSQGSLMRQSLFHGPVISSIEPGFVIRPPRKTKCVVPSSDTSEEVTLAVPGKVHLTNTSNAPFVNIPRGNESFGDEIAEPLCCKGIDLIIIGNL